MPAKSTQILAIVLFAFVLLQPVGSPAQIILSEIMFDPSGSEFYDEFIEIRNIGDSAVDLAGWRVGDADETDELLPMAGSTVIPAGAFGLILDSGYPTHSDRYAPLPDGVLLLTVGDAAFGRGGLGNRTAEPVILVAAAGDTIARATYTTGNVPGRSEEKIDPFGGDSAANWADARWDGGTPGRVNSVSLKDVDLAVRIPVDGPHLAPAAAPSALPVEITNVGQQSVAGYEVRLTGHGYPDQTRSRSGLEPGQTDRTTVTLRSLPTGPALLTVTAIARGDQDPTNNSDTITAVYGLRSDKVKVSEIMYTPAEGGSEWIELVNLSEENVNTSFWRVRDARGGEGALVAEPGLDLAPMGYAVLADDASAFSTTHPAATCPVASPVRWPTLNDGGDVVVILDGTGVVVDSVVYPAPGTRRPGLSLERISLASPGHDPDSWLASTGAAGSTPGEENSVSSRDVGNGVALSAEPNPFVDQTEIRIVLPVERAHANLWVFDRAGRKVASLLDGAEGGSRRTVIWHGTTDSGASVKPGVYILFLEATAPAGRSLRARTAVVFAEGL